MTRRPYRHCRKLSDLGLPRQMVLRSPADPCPVSAEEYMDALRWQVEHPHHELAVEGAEAVARALRRRARGAGA